MAEQRCLLIIPAGNVNRQTGGGQRTALLFNALRQIGPTDVVLLGNSPDAPPVFPDNQAKEWFFPEAGTVWRVATTRYPTGMLRGFGWLWYNFKRFARIDRMYAPEPRVVTAISELMAAEHQVVAFRYSLPYCISGITETDARKVFVDIDDRDDQKFASAAQALMGNSWPARLFAATILPKVQRILTERLSKASLLWYASEEDMLRIPGVEARLLRNVPFFDVPTDMRDPVSNKDVLFVGTHAHRPNLSGARWFLRHCWPHIQQHNPESRFRIVGRGNWASLAPEFPDLKNVDYVGTVPDLLPEYDRARITVSPVLEGGGSKIKVIESCAFGRLPVVSAHSARGFGTRIEEALPKAADAAEFIDLCDLYLRDDAALREQTNRLRALQQAEFSRAAAEAQIAADIRSVQGAA